MKKILTTTALLLALVVSYNHIDNFAHAAGGAFYGARLTAFPASGTSDGSSPVTITVYSRLFRCSIQQTSTYNSSLYYEYGDQPGYCESRGYGDSIEEAAPNQVVDLVASGSGNSLSASRVTTDGSGYATITIKSSVAESKTIHAHYPTNPTASGVIGSMSLSFNVPVPAASAPKATSKPATVTAPVEAAPPAAPTTDIKLAGTAVDPKEKLTLEDNEPLVLSGKTVPNGVVTIYVFSEPKKYTVTADKDGNWAYKVSGLPAGDHHIEAEVTDPATGKTSSRAQVLAFSVAKHLSTTKAQPAASYDTLNAAAKNGFSVPAIIGMAISGLLVLVALSAAYLWKFKNATFKRIVRI